MILYLLVGRNTKYFFPKTVKLLASGDEIRAKTRYVVFNMLTIIKLFLKYRGDE